MGRDRRADAAVVRYELAAPAFSIYGITLLRCQPVQRTACPTNAAQHHGILLREWGENISGCAHLYYGELLFSKSNLFEVNLMSKSKVTGLKPGQHVPVSGQYQIIGPRGGRGPEVTSVRGEPLPPAPRGSTFTLVDPTRHENKR